MCYRVSETACAVSDRHAYSCLHHRESDHTVRSICSFVHCAMATLIEGEFVDDGTLPKRVVLSTARGGLVATVAQGHCALALWRGLKCIQHMRKARVKTTVCRGGLVRQNEAKAAPRALECQVLDPGAGFINGEATCKGTDGKVMHGHVVVYRHRCLVC